MSLAQTSHEKQATIDDTLAVKGYAVVVTTKAGRVIQMAPRETKTRAEREARRFRIAAAWVASAVVQEVR